MMDRVYMAGLFVLAVMLLAVAGVILAWNG